MRRGKARSADEPAGRTDRARTDPARTDPTRADRLLGHSRSRANGWPVVPLRLFLAALFGFAGYAKFSYPNFFEPDSPNGFKAAVDGARNDTPLGGLMGPLADHPSFFGHLTAYAEIAIGLGLLVGLLTRLAALGGMVLTTMIVLSINWNGVKEYTGSSGWFTSAEIVLAAALSVFLLGGSGPFALDNLFIRARERQRARDDAEPSFRDSELDDSRRRLQGEPGPASGAGAATAQLPVAGGYGSTDRDGGYQGSTDRDDLDRSGSDRGASAYRPEDSGGAGYRAGDPGETVYRTGRQDDEAGYRTGRQDDEAGYRTGRQDEEYRDDPEPEPNSLWTEGRRGPGQPPAEPRRDG
ncbi:MAG TPA: DoxX family membrane protein [Jatrophihabitans sp.]|nr:DoxX family membrane protein [Jatrophihabitans sp.]